MKKRHKVTRCASGTYCNFKVIVSPYLSNGTEQKEICRLCGRMVLYRFNTFGQMLDEEGYFVDHIRDFAQPGSKVFMELYGQEGMDKVMASSKQQEESKKRQEYLSEQFRKYIGAPVGRLMDTVKVEE